MQALAFDGSQLEVQPDYPDPSPAAGEAVIRVLLAGICSTDLEILRGYADFRGVPGHEFVGVVAQCPGRPDLVGQRVVGEINVGCGQCTDCRVGKQTHCRVRTALGIRGRDGAFAEYLSLPVRNLHQVPDSVPDRLAVFAEPLAAALRILGQVNVRASDRVIVLGDGKMGQLIARSLVGRTKHLVVVGRQDGRRTMQLLRAAGISATVAAELSPGWADMVVECTGQPGGLVDALHLVRAEGTIVLKSTYAGHPTIDMSRVVVDEISLVGSRCGPFAPALEALAAKAVDPEPLVEAVYGLDEAKLALEHAGRSGTLKVLLRP